MLLDGLHIPLTTPFYPDGRFNPRKLEHNVDRFSRTPAAGLLILGPLGEPITLDDADTREALASAISAAAPEKVMLAGIARAGVASVLALADHAASLLYDAILLATPPTLTAAQNREAITFFQTIADRSPLPLILEASPATLAELASHPNIIATLLHTPRPGLINALRQQTSHIRKTATVTTVFAAVTRRMQAQAPATGPSTFVGIENLQSGGTALATAVPAPTLKTRTRETGFQILTTSSTAILPALRESATGVIPPMAACAPQAAFEVLAGWKDGDQGLAEEKQNRLIAAAARIEQLGIPAIKHAADLNGYFGGHPRLPLLPSTAAEKSEIESLMHPMRS